jgi:hypothetical protein
MAAAAIIATTTIAESRARWGRIVTAAGRIAGEMLCESR